MSPLPSGTRFPIQVISTIKPANNAPFPVVSDVDIEGSYQVRTTIIDRDSTPTNNRKEGMLVFVQEDGNFYTLSGGIENSNWIIANLSGRGPNYDLTGSSDEITVGRINNFPVGSLNATTGYLASVPEYENLHIFKTIGKICTDGAHIWNSNLNSIEEDKSNFTKTVLVDYGASYGLDYISDLFGSFTGTTCAVDPFFSPYLFLSSNGSERLLVIEKATDRVIGIGESGAQTFTNLIIDSDGNIWGTSVTHGEQICRFNTQNIIDDYPSVVSPELSISIFSGTADLFYDGYSMWAAGGSFIERILASSVTYLDNYDAAFDFPGLSYVGVCVVNDFIFATSEDQIHRFNISSFSSGPTIVQPASRGLFGKIIFSNNFLWVINAGSGELHQFDMSLNEITVFDVPVISINSGLAITKHPRFNEIYIGFAGSDSAGTGILTFNTETFTYNLKRFYTQLQSPQIKSVPASCNNAGKPENPFVGQMVFVTDLGLGIPQWWNGSSWVDATGSD